MRHLSFRPSISLRGRHRAATFTLIGGAAVSLLTALTGFWDWLRSTESGTQARRTADAHDELTRKMVAMPQAPSTLRTTRPHASWCARAP